MNYLLIFFSVFGSLIYGQCDATSELQCESNSACNWVENINYGNCSNLGSSSCDANPNCWGAYTNPGWYYGWYCAGGSYQIDNSYCTEDPTFELECTQMNELECGNDVSCEWVEDISYGSCSNLSWQVCESYLGCYVDSNPGWYDNSGPYCTGGTYHINNSYCEEFEFLPGDINGDGILNISDIILIVNLILNLEYDQHSDTNGDGVVNVIDVISIVNKILGE